MNIRYAALVAGIAYLLVGIMGFIPPFVSERAADAPNLAVEAGYGYLLGLFPINILHNIVHAVIGVLGIMAYRSVAGSRRFLQGLAIFYGLLVVFGLIPALNLNTTFGLIPIFGHDVWLHAISAALAAYFGFMARPTESREARI